MKSEKLRFLQPPRPPRHPLFTVLLYKVGIDRATVVVEAVQFFWLRIHGIPMKWSWKVMEKSWNFISEYLWEPCFNFFNAGPSLNVRI